MAGILTSVARLAQAVRLATILACASVAESGATVAVVVDVQETGQPGVLSRQAQCATYHPSRTTDIILVG